jgi:ribosomal protein S27E
MVAETGISQYTKAVKLVVGHTDEFKAVRCNSCNALLYRVLNKSAAVIEIKCRRCGNVSSQ